MSQLNDKTADESLEADGFRGFALGTVSGQRTRRYHALLLCATVPPTGRLALVNVLEALGQDPDGCLPHLLSEVLARRRPS
jgi:hypothetical protein